MTRKLTKQGRRGYMVPIPEEIVEELGAEFGDVYDVVAGRNLKYMPASRMVQEVIDYTYPLRKNRAAKYGGCFTIPAEWVRVKKVPERCLLDLQVEGKNLVIRRVK